MSENTKIEWADHTFNPWTGCSKVSPACDNCYAETWAKRAGRPELWQGERRRTTAQNWRQPQKWNAQHAEFYAMHGRRQRVFCASLADVFDNQVPEEWRNDIWQLIRETPHLDWLLLTKRPQNIAKMLPADWGDGYPNVWLGTTVENQKEADRRIPELLKIPAVTRFLSMEPLLGLVDISIYLYSGFTEPPHDDIINWVITGGESGPGARPSHPDWFRAIRDQCVNANVAFHFKQWGEWWPYVDEDKFTYHGNVTRQNAQHYVNLDGSTGECWLADGDGTWVDYSGCPEEDCYVMNRVGKQKAGRQLDGRTWDEFPEVQA